MTSSEAISSQLVVLKLLRQEALRFHQTHLRLRTKTLCLPHKIAIDLWKVQIVMPLNGSWDNMIWYKDCMEYPRLYPLQTHFIVYLIYYFILYIPSYESKARPAYPPLRIIQVFTFSYGSSLYISGTRSCWRRSLVCLWWLNTRCGGFLGDFWLTPTIHRYPNLQELKRSHMVQKNTCFCCIDPWRPFTNLRFGIYIPPIEFDRTHNWRLFFCNGLPYIYSPEPWKPEHGSWGNYNATKT